jgi:hypothetical protein
MTCVRDFFCKKYYFLAALRLAGAFFAALRFGATFFAALRFGAALRLAGARFFAAAFLFAGICVNSI